MLGKPDRIIERGTFNVPGVKINKRGIKMNVLSVSMRKALIIWEEYIEAKARNEELFLKSVS